MYMARRNLASAAAKAQAQSDGGGAMVAVLDDVSPLGISRTIARDIAAAAGATGIYNVATLPEVRRRGMGAAITARALPDGRAHDYRIGTLQSSEMGYPIYEGMGLREYFSMQ